MITLWSTFKSKIPRRPGVYIYKDKKGEVLYVGKAIDLKTRVSSYFRQGNSPVFIDRIANIETITVESELEALILEANLIKKYFPPFNIRLMDDKDYLYITVTKEDFPKIITARKQDLTKKYWGPFPSSRTVKETLKSLRRIFPWCTSASQGDSLRRRPCFYYHLGLCPGACIGLITKKDYNKNINRFSKFMDGKINELISDLTREMMQESQKQRFEISLKIKKTIEGIMYIRQPNRTKLYLENPNFLQEESQKALIELKKDLTLNSLPNRIEGYDISNIQGVFASGSMVTLTEGEIDKSQYRKFKINPPAGGSGKPNDVGMMAEMIRRRFQHDEWPKPDLILIDGGLSQVRAAKHELGKTGNDIPVFGLAKRMEWLYPPEGEILKLPRTSLSLKLLQKLRDEAHRFAISYHRKLRGKMFLA